MMMFRVWKNNNGGSLKREGHRGPRSEVYACANNSVDA